MHQRHYLQIGFGILFFALCSVLSSGESSAQEEFTRVWKSGKVSMKLAYVSHDEKEVTLRHIKGKSEGKLTKVPLKILSEGDRKFLEGLAIIKVDKEQFDTVMPHMARYTESPMAVAAILEQIADDQPNGPYAFMMAGLAQATENANYRDAKKNFRDAVNAILRHQKVLGEGFHSRTLVSLRNNIGVCELKMSKGDNASKAFAAGATGEIPFALYHNATLLMESTTGPSLIKFTNKWKKELVKILAKKKPESPGVEVPRMYLFSLEWDNPLAPGRLSELVRLDGKPLPTAASKSNLVGGAVFESEEELIKRGYTEHAAASGVMISPQLMLTNRHIVQSKGNDLSYTVTRFLQDGAPELVGGKIVKWSVVHEEDLALVELDRPIEKIVPVALRQKQFVPREKLTVLGFPKAFTRGEHLQATSGEFLEFDPDNPWVFTSNVMEKGVGGGPCLDVNGNLVGLAFAKTDFRLGRFIWFNNLQIRRTHYNHTVAVSNDAIIEFMRVAKPEFKFPAENNQPFGSRHQLVEKVRGSVLLVKSWKANDDTVHKVRPDYIPEGSREAYAASRKKSGVDLASIRKKRLFPDLWCMTCSGHGEVRCLTCAGTGKVQYRETVDTGNRNGAGGKIYRPVIKTKTCPHCNHDPVRDCKDCVKGKLRFDKS